MGAVCGGDGKGLGELKALDPRNWICGEEVGVGRSSWRVASRRSEGGRSSGRPRGRRGRGEGGRGWKTSELLLGELWRIEGGEEEEEEEDRNDVWKNAFWGDGYMCNMGYGDEWGGMLLYMSCVAQTKRAGKQLG